MNDSEKSGSLQFKLRDFQNSLRQLELATQQPKDNPLLIDGTIQRFEFCFELMWKVLQKKLTAEGLTVASPRAAIKEAYAQGWLEEEAVWLQMLNDRNLTSHTYREQLAADIFSHIPAYHKAMSALAAKIDTK